MHDSGLHVRVRWPYVKVIMPLFGKLSAGINDSYRILACLNRRKIQTKWILKKKLILVNPELMGIEWVWFIPIILHRKVVDFMRFIRIINNMRRFPAGIRTEAHQWNKK